MLGLYRGLLRLYPASYRNQFGDEMIEVFREIETEPEKKSRAAQGIFCLREVAGLLSGALREHWRVLGGDPSWLSFPTRRFTMHTEFRFPKTTAVLMTIILAGVVLAIEKGEAIVASLTNVNPALGPIQSPHFDFVPAVIVMFVFVYAAAVAGWAILFALRRSGVHRLETSTEKK